MMKSIFYAYFALLYHAHRLSSKTPMFSPMPCQFNVKYVTSIGILRNRDVNNDLIVP